MEGELVEAKKVVGTSVSKSDLEREVKELKKVTAAARAKVSQPNTLSYGSPNVP